MNNKPLKHITIRLKNTVHGDTLVHWFPYTFNNGDENNDKVNVRRTCIVCKMISNKYC